MDLGNRVSIYQPEQEGLIFPELPKFNSVEAERQHRKERLVAACRAFAQQGFDYGFAGHLTVRDPEHPELYWTNPMCVHFDKVKMSNLILVDHDGKVIKGDHAVNRPASFCMPTCTRSTPTSSPCATPTHFMAPPGAPPADRSNPSHRTPAPFSRTT
jgi:hypothetical protein